MQRQICHQIWCTFLWFTLWSLILVTTLAQNLVNPQFGAGFVTKFVTKHGDHQIWHQIGWQIHHKIGWSPNMSQNQSQNLVKNRSKICAWFCDKFGDRQILWWICHPIWCQIWWSPCLVTNFVTKQAPNWGFTKYGAKVVTKISDCKVCHKNVPQIWWQTSSF